MRLVGGFLEVMAWMMGLVFVGGWGGEGRGREDCVMEGVWDWNMFFFFWWKVGRYGGGFMLLPVLL